jgi:hypothetical protein
VDYILAREASTALAEAARRESILLVSLPSES